MIRTKGRFFDINIQSWFPLQPHRIHCKVTLKFILFVHTWTGPTCRQPWHGVATGSLQKHPEYRSLAQLASRQGELPLQYLEFVILGCETQGSRKRLSQMLNVWPIYLHLGSFEGKGHTLSIWVGDLFLRRKMVNRTFSVQKLKQKCINPFGLTE